MNEEYISNLGLGKNSSSNRIIGLDLFRICLVLLIFVFHSQMHFGCHYGIFEGFISMGAIAMTGFYILSGFALCYTYGNKNLEEIGNLKNFYI